MNPPNDSSSSPAPTDWLCPALGWVIDMGLCWELCFADGGGPKDTATWLKKWIKSSNRFASLAEFHEICNTCEHCQWSR